MNIATHIPEKLVKEVKSRGLNVVDLTISALYGGLDLKIITKSCIELAKKYLGEAIQAPEKTYKVVEECIKALAEYYKSRSLKKYIKEVDG